MKRRKNVFHFTWDTKPAQINEHYIYKRYLRRGYYSEPQLHHFKRQIWPHDLKLKVISLLTLKLTEKAEMRSGMAYKLFPRNSHEYHTLGVLGMAKKHDIPPLAIHNAYMSIANTRGHQSYCRDEHKKAIDLDITSTKNSQKFKTLADEFENRLIAFFDNHGVRYKTEEQIKEEQIAQYGRAIATVDILFEDDVYINGKLIRWLECKNYILAKNKVIEPKVARQLQRYVNCWGDGGVVYRHGYLFEFPIAGVTTFDGGDFESIKFIR